MTSFRKHFYQALASYQTKSSNKTEIDLNQPLYRIPPQPATPEEVYQRYRNYLTEDEQKEIFHYEKIYFIGVYAKKPLVSVYKGHFVLTIMDHIAYRYEILEVIGFGGFGQVARCYDHRDQVEVALKVVRNDDEYQQEAKQEVRILKQLRNQKGNDSMNIIQMLDSFTFRDHMCLVFELMALNLRELIIKVGKRPFPLQTIRSFGKSILQCLDTLSRNKIVHCDIKPENIVLKDEECLQLKLIDFGLSLYESDCKHVIVGTNGYRAPEVTLCAEFGTAADMWSLGCLLAELYLGGPLFSGDKEDDVVACIIEILGMPTKALLNKSLRAGEFFNSQGVPLYCDYRETRHGIEIGGGTISGIYRGAPGSKGLYAALANCDDSFFLNFLQGCLDWDPKSRMTPTTALNHMFITNSIK